MVVNQQLTELALEKRHNWEVAKVDVAPGVFADTQVMDMIGEIRNLRRWLMIVIAAGENLPTIRPVQKEAAEHLGVEAFGGGMIREFRR